MAWTDWPDVNFADIYNYLVLTVGVYTRDQLKVFRWIKFISEVLGKFLHLYIYRKYFTKPAKIFGDLTTNGPTTDLEHAEDTLDDVHLADDSQVVIVGW